MKLYLLNRIKVCVLGMILIGLGGCSSSNQEKEDLEAFMKRVSLREPRAIEPIPHFAEPHVYQYTSAALRDPFTPPQRKMSLANRPDMNREKEPLEAFPVDGLRIVGTLYLKDTMWALIAAPDKTVYKVKPGNYMGQDFGEIKQITKNEIVLTETINDGQGGWQKQKRVLSLEGK